MQKPNSETRKRVLEQDINKELEVVIDELIEFDNVGCEEYTTRDIADKVFHLRELWILYSQQSN